MLLSRQLLTVAGARIEDATHRSEANLRRATSDLYYAVFHAVCEALVEPLGLNADSDAFREMYVRLYRQLDHGYAERRCKTVSKDGMFDPAVAAFAKQFITLKNKREIADYDPLAQIKISEVRNHHQITEARLSGFWNCAPQPRSAFACFVALTASDF